MNSAVQVKRLFYEVLEYPAQCHLVQQDDGKHRKLTTDEEALKALAAKGYRLPQILQEHRQIDKLRGTFLDGILARVTAYHRIHSDFQQAWTLTGRLSARNPNVQQIPRNENDPFGIRHAFIAPPGYVIVGGDYCLHPDTQVLTIRGAKRIADLRVGEKLLTLRTRRIAWGTVVHTAVVTPLPSYRLTFDSGESVIASARHVWPVQVRAGIVQRTTHALAVGERMVPCRRGYAGLKGYATWYALDGATSYVYEHRLVAHASYGPRPVGCHVHHLDGDHLNNAPENLRYVPGGEHLSRHSKQNYRRQDHGLRLRRLRAGLRRRRTYRGSENPNALLTEADIPRVWALHKRGLTHAQVGEAFGVRGSCIANIVHGKTWRHLRPTENHPLIGKEYVGMQPMHSIQVEPDRNFVLARGVVTCDSWCERTGPW